MIFKTITDLQGKTTLGTNFGNIKDFITRKNILSNSDISAIKAYNNEFTRLSEKVGTSTIHVSKHTIAQKAANNTMQNASEKAKNIVKNANDSTVALDSLTRSSKAAAIGMKALSIAGNMIVSFVIFKGIELIASTIDNYANRVKYAQERLDEFSNTVSESKNNLKTQEEWIAEHGKRYEELSQGVDNYGHVVSLTAEEISEYNSLTTYVEYGAISKPNSNANLIEKYPNFVVNLGFGDTDSKTFISYIEQFCDAKLASYKDIEYKNREEKDWKLYSYERLRSYYDAYEECLNAIMQIGDTSTENEKKIVSEMYNSYASIQANIRW